DADVINCLKMLTFVPLEEIYEFEKLKGSALNPVKERLAFELTKLIHGEKEANKVLDAAKALFSDGENDENMPCTILVDDNFTDDKIGILDMMMICGLIGSKADGRRLVQQGGVSLNNEKVEDPQYSILKADIKSKDFIIKKGKKVFHRIKL
ncbi:MAG: tyrosine--tRNA ligase, partial [Oscillospiraceae bacterium]